MENETKTEETKETCSCGEHTSGKLSCPLGCLKWDGKFLLSRVKDILTNPKTCWTAIKEEPRGAKEVIQDYFWLLALIPAVFGFVGMVVVGIDIPYFGRQKMPVLSGFIYYLLSFLAMIGIAYLAALVLEKVAPWVDASVDTNRAFKLIAYSSTPSLLAGVLMIIPGILSVLVSLLGLGYSVYLYWEGVPQLVDVKAEKRVPFTVISLAAILVTGAVVMILLNSIIHPMPTPTGMGKGLPFPMPQ